MGAKHRHVVTEEKWAQTEAHHHGHSVQISRSGEKSAKPKHQKFNTPKEVGNRLRKVHGSRLRKKGLVAFAQHDRHVLSFWCDLIGPGHKRNVDNKEVILNYCWRGHNSKEEGLFPCGLPYYCTLLACCRLISVQVRCRRSGPETASTGLASSTL